MHRRLIEAVLIAGLALGTAGSPWAQQRQAKPGPALQYDPSLDANDQLAPSQVTQPIPAAVPTPTGPGHATARAAKHAASDAPAAPREATRKQPRPAIFRDVACSGPFSKDSSNLKLAMLFDSRNVTFTDVDLNGSRIGASILFPKDPKRRLEIWWSNSTNRSGIYLILINGQSTWGAPGGMRLGLTLAELEKLNHKPFKLKGFDKDNVATVSGWDGGALATLTGGCKSGVSLHADPKAPADAVTALPADHEYSSSDPALRAVNPTVSEILLGY